jgi:3-hydroxyisobutyrate dehydrogenase-like beta-hydroxyacid dehydrogenase
MATVGLVGTGTMGAAMAGRLLQVGHEVVIYDARPESMTALAGRGAVAAGSVGEVADHCRVVITSLPGPAQVEAVATELAASGRPNDVHVGHSTVSVDSARRTAAIAERADMLFLDAPVSGGSMGVDAGTLAVLASGPASAFEVARPFLDAYTGRIFELGGDPGVGTLAKLANNAIFLCSGLIHQEAVVLATKAGMSPDLLDEVLGASSASMYLGLAGPTLSRVWEPAWFATSLAEKDIALALESARLLEVPMPVTAAAHQHYVRALAAGYGDKLCLSTLHVIEEAAGVTVPARAQQPNP